MHGRMNWGNYPHQRYSGAGMDMDLPLIPAPVAAMTMILGLAIGVMIGYKKASMRGGTGMTGGMGHGMAGGTMGAGHCCRKKTMMRAMAAHHHHEYGSGPCWCGAEGESAEVPEGAEKEATGNAPAPV